MLSIHEYLNLKYERHELKVPFLLFLFFGKAKKSKIHEFLFKKIKSYELK